MINDFVFLNKGGETPIIHHTQKLAQNIRAKTIKHLEENLVVNLHDIGFDNGFLDTTTKSNR